MCSASKWQGALYELPPEWADPEKAKVLVIPAPYEGTVSYGKGTAKGPEAIFRASQEVEHFDIELGTIPAQIGFSYIQPLALENLKPEQAVQAVEKATIDALQKGKKPVMLGGEHSLSAGSIRAVREFCKEVMVLHLDAHADLRQEYEGEPWSHACVMRRVHDLGVKVVSVGIRNISAPEYSFCREKKLPVYFMHRLRSLSGWEEMVARELGSEIYITLDLDVLDPACMPGTGTPEPGGMSYLQLLNLFKTLARSGKQLLGMDMVELAPIPGQQVSEFTAARLLYQMMGLFWLEK
jgi:agmatinase